MPRQDASGNLLTSIARDWAQPVYFVEIDFDTGGGVPLRVTNYSENLILTPANDTYIGLGIKVNIGPYNEISASCDIEIPDTEKSLLALIDSQGLGQTVRIYQGWIDSRSGPIFFPIADTMFLFFGIVAGAPNIGKTITLRCSQKIGNRRIPHIICGPPTNNHNVPPGTQISFYMGTLDITE